MFHFGGFPASCSGSLRTQRMPSLFRPTPKPLLQNWLFFSLKTLSFEVSLLRGDSLSTHSQLPSPTSPNSFIYCTHHNLCFIHTPVYSFSGLPWWLKWERIGLQWRRPGFEPWAGKIPWRRNLGNTDYPLQYSCLETSMARGAWWATVHGVAKSQTRLSD